MHTGNRYKPIEFFKWTFRSTLVLLFLAAIPTILYHFGWKFLGLPWPPIAIVGTVVAFVIGFKNNASYNRIWEARQIYGSIINDSRSFGYTVRDSLGGKNSETVKRIFYRHIAWLTALRFQLREPKSWENTTKKSDTQYRNKNYAIPERKQNLKEELQHYLSETELDYILSKKNKATQLTALQSEEITELKRKGQIDDFEWTLLQQSLSKFTDSQGKSERIKNFPYPRNFASIATYLIFIFVVLVPFGLLKELDKLGDGTFLEGYTIWFNIPFSAIITWAFHTLDVIGESSVNPFEGSANDIPITQISRTIEIDMKDMLDESNLPDPITPINDIVL
ncbi:bestrophin family protein [Flavobacterium poyangense]|uniref:bestrophin family protein n=1 Tax=Flavobacterium poyangense TaxID=2204302 RepID=UPI00141D880D|nr:bestrophin family ion channel [Flavobacterium sp. JXAS1]